MSRRTRILATIGPASREPDVLQALIAAGLDAVRLNFSHGTHEAHAETFRRVREAAAACGREVAILQDLQGPKIRLGKIDGALQVTSGSQLIITTRSVLGKDGVVPTDYPELATDVSVGMKILLDEGRVSVVVRSIAGTDVVCEVLDGGFLSSNKGLSVPGATLTASAMTEKDRRDLRFGLELGVDYVALSFVRQASDVHALRELMREHGRVVPIVAKIETQRAVDVIDEIVAAADGIMVARGDLAIEASLEMIPAHQKRIIASANRGGKLVITATQMLESMTDNALPTRAEVTDVANSILDGTDAVMLSGETAVGKHPVESVRRMGSIATTTEDVLYSFERSGRSAPEQSQVNAAEVLSNVSTRVAAQAAREADAKAIVVFTLSGATAARLSSERPRAPIFAFTPDVQVRRRLALHWGVRAFPTPARSDALSPGEFTAFAEQFLRTQKVAGPGDAVVVLFGSQGAPDDTRTVQLVSMSRPIG